MNEPLRVRDYLSIRYKAMSLGEYLSQCFMQDDLMVVVEKQGRDIRMKVYDGDSQIADELILQDD